MRQIAVAGHLCVDLTPRLIGAPTIAPGQLVEVGGLRISLGGSVANTGRNLAALGSSIRVFACVGDDQLAAIVANDLAAEVNIDSTLQTIPGASTSYSIVFEPNGADRTFWHHVGSNEHFSAATVNLAGVEILHIGYPPLLPALFANDGAELVDILRSARRERVTTSLDLAVVDAGSPAGDVDWETILRSAAPWIDLLTPSLDDLTSALGIVAGDFSPSLVEELATRLLTWGVGVVAISAGAGGVFVKSSGSRRLEAGGQALAELAASWADAGFWTEPITVPDPVTTNGAGDAASAGFVFGLSAGLPLVETATLAMACAATTISGRRTYPNYVSEYSETVATNLDNLARDATGGKGQK